MVVAELSFCFLAAGQWLLLATDSAKPGPGLQVSLRVLPQGPCMSHCRGVSALGFGVSARLSGEASLDSPPFPFKDAWYLFYTLLVLPSL